MRTPVSAINVSTNKPNVAHSGKITGQHCRFFARAAFLEPET
jgi:hypothetical protein